MRLAITEACCCSELRTKTYRRYAFGRSVFRTLQVAPLPFVESERGEAPDTYTVGLRRCRLVKETVLTEIGVGVVVYDHTRRILRSFVTLYIVKQYTRNKT